MALAYHVAGPLSVRFRYPKLAGWDQWMILGYARDGVRLIPETRYVSVFTDADGGQDGVPTMLLQAGKWVRLQLELARWDDDQLRNLTPFGYGQPGDYGDDVAPTGVYLLSPSSQLAVRLEPLVHVDERLEIERACVVGQLPLSCGSRTSRWYLEFLGLRVPSAGQDYQHTYRRGNF